jgi:hypothetical protein
MAFTRTTADPVLKEFYLPLVRQILNNKVFLLTQVEQNSEDIEGRRAVLAINVGRNSGVGARAEYGTLPSAGQQGYAEERVSLKYNYGRIELSGPAIRSTQTDVRSFMRAVSRDRRRHPGPAQRHQPSALRLGHRPIAVLCAPAPAPPPLTNPTAAQLRQLTVGAGRYRHRPPRRRRVGPHGHGGQHVGGHVHFRRCRRAVTAADIVTAPGRWHRRRRKESPGSATRSNHRHVVEHRPTWSPTEEHNRDDPAANRAVSEDINKKAAGQRRRPRRSACGSPTPECTATWPSCSRRWKRFPTSELHGGYSRNRHVLGVPRR